SQTTCALHDTGVDDFSFYGAALTGAQVATWSAAALDPRPNFRKLMLSEVSWVAPRGFEITNFNTSTASLTDWRIKWLVGSTIVVSDPINLTVAPGESVG